MLVEVEPVSYELHILDEEAAARPPSSGTIPSRPKVTRKDVVLAKTSLFRFGEGKDREARMQKVLSYNYEKSEYYGQVSMNGGCSKTIFQGGKVTSEES